MEPAVPVPSLLGVPWRLMDASDATEPVAGVPTDRTLTGILDQLKGVGFVRDMFVTEDAQIRCGQCHHDAAPASLELHGIKRVEGVSDPGDEAAVLALACKECGALGTAVVRYGPEAGPQDDEVLRALEDLR